MTDRPADQIANDPVRNAASRLELLSPETREQVLSRMPADVAQRIRDFMASQPSNRPHGQFSTDVATRRQLIHDTANRVAQQQTTAADRLADELDPATPSPTAGGMPAQAPAPVPAQPVEDPLAQLRTLHPAAVARAMQGERAEAWAIVLDRLDQNAQAALAGYLDGPAHAAIADARARQVELAASSPALLDTIVAAIARTVVPRAAREHHHLLSTTPTLSWTSMPA